MAFFPKSLGETWHLVPLCAGTRSFLPHKKGGNSFAKEASIRFLLRLRIRYPASVRASASFRPSAGAAMHIQPPFTPLKRPSKAAVKCETWGGRAGGRGCPKTSCGPGGGAVTNFARDTSQFCQKKKVNKAFGLHCREGLILSPNPLPHHEN